MSANDIAKMDFKQLRNEVQMLRDELAMMQRKYEDILYNLDDDNFSGTFLREKDGMKTAIKVTAEGLESKVSNEEMQSTIKQTEDTISTQVNNLNNTLSSRINQNANKIKSEVNALTDADKELSAQITQTASSIKAEVSELYETKEDATAKESTLKGSIANVETTASNISSKVQSIEGGTFGQYTLFEQTADKFKFIGNVEMSGNAIVGGEISGAILKNSAGTHKLQMGYSGRGTFSLQNQWYDYDMPYFYIFDDTLGKIYIGSVNSYFLQVVSSKKADDTPYSLVKPIGTWDFTDSSCTLILPDGIGGGGSGSGELAGGNLVIEHTSTTTDGNAVNFYAFGDNFMGYNENQHTLYAKGDWNFTWADEVSFKNTIVNFTDTQFKGLNVTAKFA
jgi:hypothetical protein